ncbi:Glutaredoxin [Balamuthia mandrillaris]
MATTPFRRAIRLFTKSDCGLCEDAKHVLLRVRSKAPFELEEVDIRKKENEEWMLKYCFDIPVVHLNGTPHHVTLRFFRLHRAEITYIIRSVATKTKQNKTKTKRKGSVSSQGG